MLNFSDTYGTDYRDRQTAIGTTQLLYIRLHSDRVNRLCCHIRAHTYWSSRSSRERRNGEMCWSVYHNYAHQQLRKLCTCMHWLALDQIWRAQLQRFFALLPDLFCSALCILVELAHGSLFWEVSKRPRQQEDTLWKLASGRFPTPVLLANPQFRSLTL
jgi:hypothetical protein